MLTTVYSFNDGTLSTVAPYSALIGYTMYTVSIPEDLNPSVFPNGDIYIISSAGIKICFLVGLISRLIRLLLSSK